MKRTKIRIKGISTVTQLKDDIQYLVRLIVTKRDGGCILRAVRGCGAIASVLDDKVVSDTVIQADHLRPRNHSSTYADTRLIVCVCRGCHMWKEYHEQEYNALVRTIISKERVELWDKAINERFTAFRTGASDWALHIVALKQELKNLQK